MVCVTVCLCQWLEMVQSQQLADIATLSQAGGLRQINSPILTKWQTTFKTMNFLMQFSAFIISSYISFWPMLHRYFNWNLCFYKSCSPIPHPWFPCFSSFSHHYITLYTLPPPPWPSPSPTPSPLSAPPCIGWGWTAGWGGYPRHWQVHSSNGLKVGDRDRILEGDCHLRRRLS